MTNGKCQANGNFEISLQKDTSIHNQDSLKSEMLNEFEKRNTAFMNNDLQTIFFYSHTDELRLQNFEEFKNASEKYIQSTERSKLSIKNFEIQNVGKIEFCNLEYQCIINIKTTMIMDKDEFSFIRKIIAISKNGSEWIFINGGENDINTIKKTYPVVCIDNE